MSSSIARAASIISLPLDFMRLPTFKMITSEVTESDEMSSYLGVRRESLRYAPRVVAA